MSKSIYITLALVIGALTAGATSVFASNYGKKLDLLVDHSGKPKSLTIAYAYDHTWGWYISAATNLKNEDIAALPEKLNVKLINLSSGKVFYSKDGVSKNILLYTNLMVSDEAPLREFLPDQKNSAVLISNAAGESLYYLPLSDACSYAANVSDLTRLNKPACVVDPKDFGNKSVQCDEQRTKLLEYVKLGYTTCTSAKEIYSKLGCGELDCK